MGMIAKLDGMCKAASDSLIGTKLDACITLVNQLRSLFAGGSGMATTGAVAIGGTKTNIATGAFSFAILGVPYYAAAVAAGTAPQAVTLAQGKWGAQSLEIGVNGTIDTVACTNGTVGLATKALAIADLPVVSASHVRIGYVTVNSKSNEAFIWATHNFDRSGHTAAFYSSTPVVTDAVTALA